MFSDFKISREIQTRKIIENFEEKIIINKLSVYYLQQKQIKINNISSESIMYVTIRQNPYVLTNS